jgi:hypothetical protein
MSFGLRRRREKSAPDREPTPPAPTSSAIAPTATPLPIPPGPSPALRAPPGSPSPAVSPAIESFKAASEIVKAREAAQTHAPRPPAPEQAPA